MIRNYLLLLLSCLVISTTPLLKAADDSYSLNGLTRGLNSPENGNSDIYWMDAGFIEKLRPDGF